MGVAERNRKTESGPKPTSSFILHPSSFPDTPLAIVFGAGALGLGFLGDLLSRSGYLVGFVEAIPERARALAQAGRYTFHILYPRRQELTVGPVIALTPDDPGLAEWIAQAEVVITAAGAAGLEAVAQALGRCLPARPADRPLNILCCENLPSASAHLAGSIYLPTCSDTGAPLGFGDTVSARMCQRVPAGEYSPIAPGLGEAVLSEQYDRLPADQSRLVEPLPDFYGLELLDREHFLAESKRKTYCHNGIHCMLGFLGQHFGHRFIWQAAEDPRVGEPSREAFFDELGEAVYRAFGQFFSPASHRHYLEDLWARITSQAFGDTVERAARSPLEKLSGEDARAIRAANFCLEQGVPPVNFSLGIAAALPVVGVEPEKAAGFLRERCGAGEELVKLVTEAAGRLGKLSS